VRLCTPLAVLLAYALCASAAPALADEAQPQNPLNDQGSSPNYRSIITSISPSASGLHLQVLQFSDRLLLRDETGKTVEVKGYEGEPYARVRPNGSVEVNTHAPAYYLNESFYGNVTVPSFASASAKPHWLVVDRTGEFEWHDHRIHWMSPVTPPQVKDKSKRTLIFNWHVPIVVGTSAGTISGRLYWTPDASSAPVALYLVGGAIVVFGLLLVVLVRRRRSRADARGAGAGPPADAGVGADAGSREAW
jgi:hypothetical protein